MAVEGWGKTSAVSFADDCALLIAKGETGYDTLLGAGLVPAIDSVLIEDWDAMQSLLDDMANNPSLPYKNLALDAARGFSSLCESWVCEEFFDGDWGKSGYASYGDGTKRTLIEWDLFLSRLDRIHAKGVAVTMLSHCKVKQFANPTGANYDRWVSDVPDALWSITAKWADNVFFGNFISVVETASGGKESIVNKKGKGIGGADRQLFTERRDAHDGKNQCGMPPVLTIPNKPEEVWHSSHYYIMNGTKGA